MFFSRVLFVCIHYITYRITYNIREEVLVFQSNLRLQNAVGQTELVREGVNKKKGKLWSFTIPGEIAGSTPFFVEPFPEVLQHFIHTTLIPKMNDVKVDFRELVKLRENVQTLLKKVRSFLVYK